MNRIKNLHKKWSRTPEYRKAYEKLAPEFELAKARIEEHKVAGARDGVSPKPAGLVKPAPPPPPPPKRESR